MERSCAPTSSDSAKARSGDVARSVTRRNVTVTGPANPGRGAVVPAQHRGGELVVPLPAVQRAGPAAALVRQAEALRDRGRGGVAGERAPLHPDEPEASRRVGERPAEHAVGGLGDEAAAATVGVHRVPDLGRTVGEAEQPDRAEQAEVLGATDAELVPDVVPPPGGDDLVEEVPASAWPYGTGTGVKAMTSGSFAYATTSSASAVVGTESTRRSVRSVTGCTPRAY